MKTQSSKSEGHAVDRAALIGCGVITGFGAANNEHGEVAPGETVAVIGCGGVGMAAINGAYGRGGPSHRRRYQPRQVTTRHQAGRKTIWSTQTTPTRLNRSRNRPKVGTPFDRMPGAQEDRRASV